MALLTAANARPYDFGVIPPSDVSAYNSVTVADRFGGVVTNPIELESADTIGPEGGGQLATGVWCLGDTLYTCVI